MSVQRSTIPGSEPKLRAGERWLGPVPDNEPVTATILIRRPPDAKADSAALLSGTYKPTSREAAQAKLTADPDDMKAVKDFAAEQGLEVFDSNAETRRIRVRGTAAEIDRAFGVQVGTAESPDGQRVQTYQGSISVPVQLNGIITAVLGLDNRAVAAPRNTAAARSTQ